MKFTPETKMSKKARKELNRSRRNTWGNISPVTKTVASRKVYNRKRIALDW